MGVSTFTGVRAVDVGMLTGVGVAAVVVVDGKTFMLMPNTLLVRSILHEHVR